MNKQFLKAVVTKIADNLYRILASTSSIDRQGDIIQQDGWVLDNFKKNPVLLWAHDYSALPIGKVVSLEKTTEGLVAEFEFAPADANPMAEQIKKLYEGGYVNASSVGFIPLERNGNIIIRAELLELSLVPVPANQDALRRAIESKSFNGEVIAAMEKGEVMEQMTMEEMHEMKCEKWHEFAEVIGALWTVYFDEKTPVERFPDLLKEVAGIITAMANGEMEDDMDEMKGIIGKAISPEALEKFTLAYQIKAGRAISAKTEAAIKNVQKMMMDGHAVLEGLITSRQEDGEDKSYVKLADDEVVVKQSELQALRGAIVGTKNSNEGVLNLVNAFLSKRI